MRILEVNWESFNEMTSLVSVDLPGNLLNILDVSVLCNNTKYGLCIIGLNGFTGTKMYTKYAKNQRCWYITSICHGSCNGIVSGICWFDKVIDTLWLNTKTS